MHGAQAQPEGNAVDRGTLFSAVAEHARRDPSALAIVSERGSRSYSELEQHAAQIAARLRGQGLAPGDRVILIFRNTPAFVSVLLACGQARVVPVMCHPAFGWELASGLVERTGARAVIADASVESTAVAREVGRRNPSVHTFAGPVAFEAGPAIDPGDRDLADPDDPMVILTSSGSAGAPKLVVRSHRRFGLAARRFGRAWGAAPGRRFVIGSMIGHAAALGWGVLASLDAGATLIVPEDRSPSGLVRTLAAEPSDAVFVVPSQARALVDPALDVRGVHIGRIILGGERLEPELARELARRFGCEVQNTYGMTEGFCTATDPADLSEIIAGSVGRPCMDEDTLEVRDEHGVVSPGEPGTLWVRGPCLLERYWDGGPALDDRGFFNTGDRVRVLDRDVYLLGRDKRLVSRGAVKISPEDLELHLASHPAIRDVAVVGIPALRLGERMCAVIAPHRHARSPTLDELRAHLDDRGVGRLRHPDAVVIVDALAKNAVGKTDLRAALAAAIAQITEET